MSARGHDSGEESGYAEATGFVEEEHVDSRHRCGFRLLTSDGRYIVECTLISQESRIAGVQPALLERRRPTSICSFDM